MAKTSLVVNISGSDFDHKILKIGDVSTKLKSAKNPELVPQGYSKLRFRARYKYYSAKFLYILVYDKNNLPQSTLKHLRWLLQKDHLKQDVFLIGLPGTIRRRLVMQYLVILTNLSVSFLKQYFFCRKSLKESTNIWHWQEISQSQI